MQAVTPAATQFQPRPRVGLPGLRFSAWSAPKLIPLQADTVTFGRKDTTDVQTFLSGLGTADQQLLEIMFRRFDHLGLTLFGEKPAALHFNDLTDPYIQRGFRIWQREQSKLNVSSRYIFRPVQILTIDEPTMILIDQTRLKPIVERHLALFQEQLAKAQDTFTTAAEQLTSTMILDALKSDSALSRTIFQNDGLIGLILGFGHVSCMKLQRKKELCANPNLPPTPPFESGQDELAALREDFRESPRKTVHKDLQQPNATSFCPTDIPNQLSAARSLPVETAGWRRAQDDEESIRLMTLYNQDIETITEHYGQPEFLKMVLSRLTASEQG